MAEYHPADIRPNNILMSHYRSHGYYLAKGAPLDAMVGRVLRQEDGAIVGGSLYMPFGGAFAQKYRGGEDISVSVTGDGVFDEGITYEISTSRRFIGYRF
jgi:TPP-dependent pyruvate/acetoin dehydrogenase alpha subunit